MPKKNKSAKMWTASDKICGNDLRDADTVTSSSYTPYWCLSKKEKNERMNERIAKFLKELIIKHRIATKEDNNNDDLNNASLKQLWDIEGQYHGTSEVDKKIRIDSLNTLSRLEEFGIIMEDWEKNRSLIPPDVNDLLEKPQLLLHYILTKRP
ncbi:uncharacterized protein LOC106659355 [Trichogramma pretiosum]|uniref:uncharacterized protein LOC106659355 n=1 Tax=Trichogramma pretiosum TaxID=7493 RepID=UPI0006C97383|nr:uncharacterized protein LOC106659355 [Trichogramma pretiosum]